MNHPIDLPDLKRRLKIVQDRIAEVGADPNITSCSFNTTPELMLALIGRIENAEAATGAPLITFVVDVATYRESHRTTYQVRLARSDRPKGDPFDSTGITTVFISEKREEAETERAAWDAFLHGAHPTCDMDFVCALIDTLRATQRAGEPAPAKPANRSVTFRHLKSGNDYEVLHVNAVREDDGVSLVVYRSVSDRTVYVRPQSEFFAKFVEVIAIETVKETPQ